MLQKQCMLMVGVLGCLRRVSLYHLKVEDVSVTNDGIVLKIEKRFVFKKKKKCRVVCLKKKTSGNEF